MVTITLACDRLAGLDWLTMGFWLSFLSVHSDIVNTNTSNDSDKTLIDVSIL